LFLQLRILKGLRANFSELRIPKDLAKSGGLSDKAGTYAIELQMSGWYSLCSSGQAGQTNRSTG
jgi:hypothetical protein